MDIEAMNLILFFIHKTTSDLSRIDEKLILDKFFFFELGDALDISNEEGIVYEQYDRIFNI